MLRVVTEDTDATWGADGVPTAEGGSAGLGFPSPTCVCIRHRGRSAPSPEEGGSEVRRGLATAALFPPAFT